MVLTMNQYALIGVNADNGDLLFRHEHKTQYDVNATTPAYHDGQIFITSGYGSGAEMLKLKVEGKKASVEQLWAEKALDNHHGGLVILDGRIYGCSSGDRWICLDWATGKILYSQRFVGKGSLTYADGMLYVLSERSQMGLVPASPEKNKVISQCKLPRGGAGQSWAHPVVCGGRLYIRHGDVLFAFDVRGQ
jgi:outer membrane protein assembly factor BamB